MARRGRGVTIDVQGTDELRRAFARLEFAALRRAKEVIRETSEEMHTDAVARFDAQYTSESGDTRESIKVLYYAGGLIGSIGSGFYKARFGEFGTQHQEARPFIGPAWEVARPKYTTRLARALGDVEKDAR